jgi:hypothetical protein
MCLMCLSSMWHWECRHWLARTFQGFTVIGYSWYNYTSMDFHLTPGGITLSMESEGLWLSKTDTDDILSGGAIACALWHLNPMGSEPMPPKPCCHAPQFCILC